MCTWSDAITSICGTESSSSASDRGIAANMMSTSISGRTCIMEIHVEIVMFEYLEETWTFNHVLETHLHPTSVAAGIKTLTLHETAFTSRLHERNHWLHVYNDGRRLQIRRKWRQCESAWNLCSVKWPAGGDSIALKRSAVSKLVQLGNFLRRGLDFKIKQEIYKNNCRRGG